MKIFPIVSGMLMLSAVVTSHCPHDLLATHANHPTIRAFLDMIAYAEGTMNYAHDGYAVLYGYVPFEGFDDHPRMAVCTLIKDDQQLCSTAAGRYQILMKTWDALVDRIEARDFGKRNQDRAAVQLLIDYEALDLLWRCADFTHFQQAVRQVNSVWASLPESPYGQPTREWDELFEFYQQRVRYYTELVGRGVV